MRINKQIDPLEKANKKAKKHNRKPGLPFINTNAGNVQQSIGMFNGSMADGGIGMCEQLSDDVLNDLASLPKLAGDEYYHIGNIVGDTDFKQEGFHITKDINQCVYIKDQKHPEARYLYKVKFNPKNGIYFEDETGGWRARDIAGMILYNLGEQDVDEAHKIKGKNISKDLLNYRGQLRSLQMNNVTSEKGFREIAKILNSCGYDFIQYINRFETDKGKETPTLIPLKTNLQYEIIYNFDKKENDNMNEILLEAKADEQKLIDFAGEDLANRFFALKKMNRLKSPYNDLYYWLKKDVVDLEDFINDLESEKSATQQRKEDKQGAKVVYEDENGKVYEITTYDAAKYYGKGTKWCISGNYPGEENRGQELFWHYIEREFLRNNAYYFAIENDGTKYAILIDKNNKVKSIWNAEDTAIVVDPKFEEDIADSKLLKNFLNKDVGLKTLKEFKIGFESDPIFLLNEEEYAKYKDKIPLLDDWWWLRSPGISSDRAIVVYDDGYTDAYGREVDYYYKAIRPAIKIPNLDVDIGSVITLGDFDFVVIDKDLAIAKEYISKGKFDKNSNDYETSSVRKFLLSAYSEFAKDFAKYQKKADESLNEVKTKMNEEYDVYNVTTLEDVIDGMIDNASEESIDKTIKLYNKIMRFFGKKANGDHYDEIFVCIDSDWTYDPESYVDVEAFDMEKKPSPIKDIRLYQFGLNNLLVEEFNGHIFIYTDSENTLYDYLRMVDDYNNGELDDKSSEFDFEKEDNEALNEKELDEDFDNMYDWLIDSLIGMYPVTMSSGHGTEKNFVPFESLEAAKEYCEDHNWKYLDENEFEWELEIKDKIENKDQAMRYFNRYIKPYDESGYFSENESLNENKKFYDMPYTVGSSENEFRTYYDEDDNELVDVKIDIDDGEVTIEKFYDKKLEDNMIPHYDTVDEFENHLSEIMNMDECLNKSTNEAVSGKYSDKFRRLVDKGRKEEDVALVSEVANKVLDYLPEEDAEDLWKDKDFDEVEAKFVLDEGLFE